MNAATEFDLGPLTWVKGEIDLALERAEEAFGQYLAEADVTKLKFCRTHVHQVHGALSIVGLDGITQVTESLESLLEVIEDGRRTADEQPVSAIRQAITGIRAYLDELMAGEPNQPLRLLPLYLGLAQARGIPTARASDLFFPDLSVRPPKRANPVSKLAPDELHRLLKNERAGRVVTYVTLCFDLVVMVVVVVKPHEGGGLANPLLATQLLFTTLFALLYPKPLAILPPLLALPITARLDQLLDRSPTAVEVLTLLWFLGLNFIIIYVLVYLNEREVTAHREVVELQGDLKELAVVEERNRLAREIHDGLGASLSSLIIQSEYVEQLTRDDAVKKEVAELKQSAEEAIEELRRSLQMMR
ncbi:MAG: hypothetical protein RLZZ300_2077, partial [Pseudomonadota bacterium]